MAAFWTLTSNACNVYTLSVLFYKDPRFFTYSKGMLLLGSTIAFFHNAACNNPFATRRTTGTSGCYIEPEISTLEVEKVFNSNIRKY